MIADLANLDRINLADFRNPKLLARRVHDLVGQCPPLVDVQAIAQALDISEIRTEALDVLEGMLLTDRVRSCGAILANTSRGHHRKRFTIAQELGHILMEHHDMKDGEGFKCSNKDMRETREDRKHRRQEAKANQFAIGLLAPFHLVDPILSDDPDLRAGQKLRDALDLSSEASVQRMIERRSEPLAAVFTKDGFVRYSARNEDIPQFKLQSRDRLPQTTQAFRAVSAKKPGFTEWVDTHPMAWTNEADMALFEQTRVGANGYSITLLWAELPEASDDDDEKLPGLGEPGFR